MVRKALAEHTKEELIQMVCHLKECKKFGLIWEDKSEKVARDCQEKLPILKESGDKAINLAENQPTNIIIEGDNYHALSVLNYTHPGKIDVIYIDPPYNTGNQDFIYDDKIVDSEDCFRHSKWLSFMEKRLRLAKDVLSKDGVIFISIDDNEQAYLKVLCDEIFDESNFVGIFKWNKVAKAPSLSKLIRNKYEYILCYKRKNITKLYGKKSYNTQGPVWHNPNKPKELYFAEQSIRIRKSFKKGSKSEKYSVELLDDLIEENGHNKNPVRIIAASAWGQEKINKYIKDGKTFEIKNDIGTMYADISSKDNFISPADIINKEECDVDNNTDASEKLKKLGVNFNNPKPVSLVKYLIKMVCYENKKATILDFFAGSGTTGQAVLELNQSDNGSRQFILCTNNENQIAEQVTYPRIKTVITGVRPDGLQYGDGIPANVRYFKTDFVPRNKTNDKLRREIAPLCTDMIKIRENCFEQVLDNGQLKVFKNARGLTALIFDDGDLTPYIQEIEKLDTNAPVFLYVFSYNNDSRDYEIPTTTRHKYRSQPIPEGVLSVYRRIFKPKGD